MISRILSLILLARLFFWEILQASTFSSDKYLKQRIIIVIDSSNEIRHKTKGHKKKLDIAVIYEHSKQLINNFSKSSKSHWDQYKMNFPFWLMKIVTFIELGFKIVIRIFIGRSFEGLEIIKFSSFITWPNSFLCKSPQSTSPAFIFALQSCAIANSMLFAQKDNGLLTQRDLYTSFFVVSSISLFAHLPSFIVPLGMAFKWKAATSYFGVRFSAINFQILIVLLISNMFFYKKNKPSYKYICPNSHQPNYANANRHFFKSILNKSQKSINMLLIYLLPTFFAVSLLGKSGFFQWFVKIITEIPILPLLPAQAIAFIAAQLINLYNGAIIAASFVDNGSVSIRDAILIMLTSTLVTAPLCILKHSLGLHVTILGARHRTIMAIATQQTITFFSFFSLSAVHWSGGNSDL